MTKQDPLPQSSFVSKTCLRFTTLLFCFSVKMLQFITRASDVHHMCLHQAGELSYFRVLANDNLSHKCNHCQWIGLQEDYVTHNASKQDANTCLDAFVFLFCFWRNSPTRARAASCSRFVDHTELHTTVGTTPLNEGSARRRDLYLTTTLTRDRHPWH